MHILILKSATNANDVLHRLQTNALFVGLQTLNVSSSLVFLDGSPKRLTPPSHIVIDYRDAEALHMSADIKARHPCSVLCFTSDIYDLSYFMKLSSVVDCFLAPTVLHRDVIRSAVTKPVIHVPEAVDPISLADGRPARTSGNADRVCWFGYPESFDKSTRYLIPQALGLSAFDRDRFCIVTAKGQTLLEGVEHRAFDAGTFCRDTEDCGHSILSHFCYDQKLNTFIKSPNKMITSIVRGLVPLVSSTPAYREVAEQYGLEDLMFEGPLELARQLERLDFGAQVKQFQLPEVRSRILASLSPANIASRVLELL